jgi:hypothetical protein
VPELGLGRDLEHEVRQIGGRHQRVHTRAQRRERRSAEGVEPVDGQLAARGGGGDRVGRTQPVAGALVGVVEILGEPLDERVRLSRERKGAACVLARGVPRGIGVGARARVCEPLAWGHVDIAAPRPVAELLERAHRVGATVDPARVGFDQRLGCHGRGTNGVGSSSGGRRCGRVSGLE